MNLNRNLKNLWIYFGFLIALICPTAGHAQSDSLDRIVVTVDGEAITETDIQRRIRFLSYEAVQAEASPPPADVARIRAIDDAISYLVKLQRARLMRLAINVNDIGVRLEALSQQSGLTPEQFLLQLKQHGLTGADVGRFLSEVLLDELLTQRVLVRRVRIREGEIDRYLQANSADFEREDEYHLSVIVISDRKELNFQARQFLRQVTRDIEFEINTGRDFVNIASAAREVEGIDSGDLGWISVRNIAPEVVAEISKVKSGDHVGPIKTGDSTIFALVKGQRRGGQIQLRPIRQFHLARIIFHAGNEAGAEVIAEQLEEIRKNILAGADFGALAKLYSHDDDTRQNGGDLGWVSEDNLPFEYLEPMQTMEEGDTSAVQRIQNSVFILQLRAVRMASEEEQKRSVVREILRNLKLRNERSKWVDQLRAEAKINYRTTY